jgi:2-dehydropantoate 2-reductase
MKDRVLIWGAGAIGASVGGVLKQAGHDVTFVDVDQKHVELMRSPAAGLRISGPILDTSAPVPAFLPEELEGEWQHVYLCVKSQHTASATTALARHLSPAGYVLSLQNGLCEAEISDIVGKERTIGAFINLAADWIEPGHIRYASRGAFSVGEMDGSMSARLAALGDTLCDFERDLIVTDNISGYLWSKLAFASLLYAQALGEKGLADCWARPELFPLWRRLVGEVVTVAASQGVTPVGFEQFDPLAFAAGQPETAARSVIEGLVAAWRGNLKTHSGMWRDLAIRKRATEVDYHIGPVVALGHEAGIDCPACDLLVTFIHEIEAGRRPLSDTNQFALLESIEQNNAAGADIARSAGLRR